jgi:hypothetical protein
MWVLHQLLQQQRFLSFSSYPAIEGTCVRFLEWEISTPVYQPLRRVRFRAREI